MKYRTSKICKVYVIRIPLLLYVFGKRHFRIRNDKIYPLFPSERSRKFSICSTPAQQMARHMCERQFSHACLICTENHGISQTHCGPTNASLRQPTKAATVAACCKVLRILESLLNRYIFSSMRISTIPDTFS